MAKKVSYQVALDGSQDFAAPRRKCKKHNWWKYLLTFISGQLSLIVLLVVGVAIAASSFTTGALLQTIGVSDPEKLLTEDIRNKTIFETVMKFASGYEVTCIDDLTEIVPQETIDEYVGKITELTQDFGITFTDEDLHGENGLYKTPFDSIGDWFSTKLDTLELASVIGAIGLDTSEGIFHKLLYKDDGQGGEVAKTLADFENFDFADLLNDLTLVDILGEDGFAEGGSFAFLSAVKDKGFNELGDALFEVPLYQILGTDENAEGIMGVIAKKTINDIKDGDIATGMTIGDVLPSAKGSTGILGILADCYVCGPIPEDAPEGSMTIADKIDTLTIGDVMGGNKSDQSSLLQFIWDTTVTDLSSRISEMTIGVAIGGTKPDSGVLALLWDKKLDEVGDTIDNLKLSDAIGGEKSSQPKILQALWDYKVTELGSASDDLKLSDVLDSASLSSNNILANIADSKITELGTAINGLTFVQVFGDTIYNDPSTYVKGSTDFKTGQSVWKYLLWEDITDSNSDKAGTYKLMADMGSMIGNMTSNMTRATLQQLFDDGLVSGVSQATLDTNLWYVSGGVPQQGNAIGTYTISGLISAIAG